MNPNLPFFKTRLALALALLPALLVGCGGGIDPILGTPNVAVAPVVSATSPAGGATLATGVATDSPITATFSKSMTAATLNGTSFSVTCPGIAPVAATVVYVDTTRTATLRPTTVLPNGSLCTATVGTAARDSTNIALDSAFVWRFMTAALADTTRPTVVLTVPTPAGTGVPTNTRITASFSEDMNPATLSGSSFTLSNTTLGTPVTGSVSYSVAARTATFTPTAGTLPTSSAFTATISTAATDLAGNALAGNTAVLTAAGQHVWTFSTGATGDTTAPTVTAVSPAAGSTSCLTKAVSATFSEPMDASTISTTTLRVSRAGVAVAGSVRYDAVSRVASFVPSNAAGFAASSSFDAVVVAGIAGVKDLAGNALVVDRSWSFQTSTQPCAAGVDLRSIASFGTFGGGAGITNQGINTVVGGNIGTTAACTLVTGLHDANNVYTQTPLNVGAVNGSVFCAPPAPGTATSMAIATQARADALSAYNALAALPPGSDPGAGQLGGLVLQAGVYTAAGGSFGITTGDLTLDAQGDTNAVWVFQSASALTVGLPATPRRVLLVNGAQAGNVYWQVGSAARIEDRSLMVGTIIAPAGVTISTAGQAGQTTLIGRAIGLTASVTMVNTTVVAP